MSELTIQAVAEVWLAAHEVHRDLWDDEQMQEAREWARDYLTRHPTLEVQS